MINRTLRLSCWLPPKHGRSAVRMALAGLLVALLTSCQTRQLVQTPNLYLNTTIDPFQEVPEVYQNNEVDVLYLTDRKQSGQRENYVEYLRKLKNAELALSLESSQHGAQLVRLDPAVPPLNPVVPRWMIAAVGLLASIGGALALGVLREIIFPVVIDEQQLESAIPLPCLGSVSRIALPLHPNSI